MKGPHTVCQAVCGQFLLARSFYVGEMYVMINLTHCPTFIYFFSCSKNVFFFIMAITQ